MKTRHLLGLKSGGRSGSKIINLQAVKYSEAGALLEAIAQVVKVFMDQNRLQETTSILLDALKVLAMRFGSTTNLVLPLLFCDDRRIMTLLTFQIFLAICVKHLSS